MQTARIMLTAGLDRDEGLDLTDQGLIIAALEATEGNISRAARRLGMHRNTLERRLQILNLRDVPRALRNKSNQLRLPFPEDKRKKPRSTRRGGCENAA